MNCCCTFSATSSFQKTVFATALSRGGWRDQTEGKKGEKMDDPSNMPPSALSFTQMMQAAKPQKKAEQREQDFRGLRVCRGGVRVR